MVEKTQEQIAHEATTLIEPEPEIVIVDAEQVYPVHQVTPGIEPPKPTQQPYPHHHQEGLPSQQQQQHHQNQTIANNNPRGVDFQLCGEHIETGRELQPGRNFSIKLFNDPL